MKSSKLTFKGKNSKLFNKLPYNYYYFNINLISLFQFEFGRNQGWIISEYWKTPLLVLLKDRN